MALKYLSNIDLNGNQLRGASIEPLSSAPSDHLVAGRVYFDTSENVLYSHTGSAWVQVGTTYSTSVVDSSGIKLRLTGNDSTSDDVIFDGAGGLAVSAFTPPVVDGVAQPTRIRTTLSDVSGLNDVNTAIGSATIVPVITYNAKGQITGTTTATISGTLTVNADSGTQDVSLISDDLEILGTTNQITTAVTRGSSPNTDKVKVTIGLPDDVTITGNLTVSGTTTTLNTATLDVEDLNVTVGKNATTSSAADGAGLTFGAWSSGTTPTFTWVNSTSKLTANKPLQATSFHGNLTGNVTGTVSSLSNHSFSVVINVSESTVAVVTDTNNKHYDITHSLNSRDLIVQVVTVASPYESVFVDTERTDANNIRLKFAEAPTAGAYKILIMKVA
jgi:hypothetical protein